MVGVAQLVEHGIVTPVVEGSIPFVHPIFKRKRQTNPLAFFCICGLRIAHKGVARRLVSRMLSVLCDLCDNARRLGWLQRLPVIAN